MNIYDEMEKRGIKRYKLYENKEEWAYYRDLYDCIWFHSYDSDKEKELQLLLESAINTYKLVQYCKEHNEIEFLEKLEGLNDL